MIARALPGLGPDAQAAIERARAWLDDERIADLLMHMTAIASPTAEEGLLAEYVAEHLRANGVEATVQSLGGRQANVVGRLRGTGDGPRLLLYAPLDTAFSGNADEDRPWLGDAPRPDFALPPQRSGNQIVGLGAENPKGYAAAAIVALEALAAAAPALCGEAIIGLASGSMPVDGRPGFDHRPLGHGTGIRHLLASDPLPDYAITLKPGYSVVHEEVGLAWFRIRVRGAVGYTGIRHKAPGVNPIVAAARLVGRLEAWFATYTARHSGGLLAPQGSINAIRAGSPDRAAFIPATCDIDLDIRIGPDTTPEAAFAELVEAVDAFRADEPDVPVEVVLRDALPGTRTDPESWIVRSLSRAWSDREGRPHEPIGRGSGATDAAIIRSHGIPTARIGLPPPTVANPYPGFSMGVVDVASVRRLAEVLIQTVVDTVSRTRDDIAAA